MFISPDSNRICYQGFLLYNNAFLTEFDKFRTTSYSVILNQHDMMIGAGFMSHMKKSFEDNRALLSKNGLYSKKELFLRKVAKKGKLFATRSKASMAELLRIRNMVVEQERKFVVKKVIVLLLSVIITGVGVWLAVRIF